jgi:hypothetical protein
MSCGREERRVTPRVTACEENNGPPRRGPQRGSGCGYLGPVPPIAALDNNFRRMWVRNLALPETSKTLYTKSNE